MASIFVAIGASLRPDGLQPGKGTHIRRSQQPFMSQKILRVFAGVAAVAGAATGAPLTRTCYRKQSLEDLAAEALEFKDRERGTRFWRGAFLYEKYGEVNLSQLHSKQNELRAALKHGPGRSRRLEASSSTLRQRRPLHLAAFSFGVAKSELRPKTRCRDYIGKWRPSADIDAELWCWFVDRLETNKTRVSLQEILNEANQYANAILTAWRLDCEKGLASPDQPPRLPIINMSYVRRWRLKYGVSYRTVRLRAKRRR